MPTATAEFAWWIEFRSAYGLRSDVEWVEAVGDNPATLTTFGLPLLPDEEAQVIRLQMVAEALVDRVRGYGNRFPDEFAGVWIEGPLVVLAFTDHLGEHEAAVRPLFGIKVVVRPVRFTLRELKSWAGDVGDQAAWMESLGAHLIEADAEQTLNAVQVSYRAPDQTVEAQLLARLGNPPWVVFDYRGAGPWTGPRGDLELTVVDENGRPATFECLLVALDPRVTTEFAPRSIVNGECFQRGLAAVGWHVEIIYERDGERRSVLREVTVPPSGVATLRIVLEP